MQARVSLRPLEIEVGLERFDLDERIRSLIKLMVDETDPVIINDLGIALERLLTLERVTVPTCRLALRRSEVDSALEASIQERAEKEPVVTQP